MVTEIQVLMDCFLKVRVFPVAKAPGDLVRHYIDPIIRFYRFIAVDQHGDITQ